MIDNVVSDQNIQWLHKFFVTEEKFFIASTKKILLLAFHTAKAFYTINHNAILRQLDNFSSDRKFFKLFADYLSNRTNYVSVGKRFHKKYQ